MKSGYFRTTPDGNLAGPRELSHLYLYLYPYLYLCPSLPEKWGCCPYWTFACPMNLRNGIVRKEGQRAWRYLHVINMSQSLNAWQLVMKSGYFRTTPDGNVAGPRELSHLYFYPYLYLYFYLYLSLYLHLHLHLYLHLHLHLYLHLHPHLHPHPPLPEKWGWYPCWTFACPMYLRNGTFLKKR